MSHCCGLHSKKINDGVSVTGVAECIAADFASVTLAFFREKASPLLCCGLLSKFFEHLLNYTFTIKPSLL